MGDEKEGLKEKALSAYKTFLEEQEEWEKRLVQKFAEEAKEAFKRKFGETPEEVIPVSWDECLLVCDGLKFRAKEKGTGIEFFVIVKCEKCHHSIERGVLTLVRLGEILSKPYICVECRLAESKERGARR